MSESDGETKTYTILHTPEGGDEEFIEEVEAESPEDAVLKELDTLAEYADTKLLAYFISTLDIVVDDDETRHKFD